MKANRNDPCPCGSGKKFKKCCIDDPAFAESLPVIPAVPVTPVTYAAASTVLDAAIQLHQEGNLVAAELGYHEVLAEQPQQFDALHLLGVVHMQRGNFAVAVELIEEAIRLAGPNRDFLYNLGSALRGLRRDAEAISVYRQILETHADDVETLNNLGLAYRGAGQSAEALACFEKAHVLAPTDAEVYANVGLVLSDMNRVDESVAIYREVLKLNPALPEVLNNLGSSLQNLGDTQGAIESYRQALSYRPDYPEAHNNLIFSLDFVEAGGTQLQQDERKRWAARFAARTPTYSTFENSLEPQRKLRIGYISPDFRHHSAAYAFSPLILNYDHAQFEVVCYSNASKVDDLTLRFKAQATEWHEIYALNDAQAAEKIHADRIDILVDLAGHSRNNRLGVMAHRPAPIQASGWGHANGTGLPTIDYLFSDPVYIPPDEAQFYQEKLLYLPCVIGYLQQPEAPAISPLPAESNGLITFGSFSRLAKVSNEVLALWAALLRQIPHSRILFKAPELNSPGRQASLLALMADHGITPERISLQPGTPWREHVTAIAEVDIALDPYPHGGGVSVLDCLWMGVPVLAMTRPIPAGRVAAAILKVLDLSDWVAPDNAAFLALAVAKAADLAALKGLRATLRERVAASPVGNGADYVAVVEAHYRSLWQHFTQATNSR